ncbi:MAG: GtrA family protein [Pseudomonadota bacterium]
MSTQDTDTVYPSGVIGKLQSLLAEHQHLLKYLFIGGMASALDVVLFLVLFNLVGTSELIAHSISVPTSVLFSFVINARHNFKTEDHYFLRMASFFIVCIIGYVAGYGVIVAVQQAFADPDLGANVGKIASLPVVFIIQYVLNSKITFRPLGSTAH